MATPESSPGRARRLAGPRDVAKPFVRAREFLAQSRLDNPDDQADELPVARPTIAVARQVFHDELVLLGFRMFLPVGDSSALDRTNREIGAALEYYAHHGWLDKPEQFFAAPPSLTAQLPGLEERRPIDVVDQSCEREILPARACRGRKAVDPHDWPNRSGSGEHRPRA